MNPKPISLEGLAQQHGLTTADQVAPPPPKPEYSHHGSVDFEFVDETPRRPRRSDDEVEAEKQLGHHWVVLVALERPAPRHFGDNRGYWPVHVERVSDWRRSGVVYDNQQASQRAVRLAVIGVNSKANAECLKSEIDEALCGREKLIDADPLRHRFRNAIEFGEIEGWWAPIMTDVLMRCEILQSNFEVFSRDYHDQLVRRRAQEIMEKRARL